MSYLVAYTLKHNEIADTFEDHYVPFRDEDGFTIEDARRFYKTAIETDGGQDGWHIWTISLTQVIESTDY